MKKIYLVISLAVMLLLTACASWDLIGIGAVEAFDRVINSENVEIEETRTGWVLHMSDYSTAFYWSQEFGSANDDDGGIFDIAITFDARPFINAMLDGHNFSIPRLPADMITFTILSELEFLFTINVGVKLGDRVPEYEREKTPLMSFEQILRHRPELIGYHDAGHHYMLHFGDTGNMLMFARDIAAQESGVVFMLNPEPFIEAGVDVHNIEGWKFGSHETMTIRGQNVMRYFLVKSFDLR